MVFVVQVEENYGSSRIAARVCTRGDGGELRDILWSSGRGAHERFAGFAVTAYVDSDERGVWGFGYHVDVRMDSARHAKAVAGLLGAVERGLDKLNQSDGYLPGDDFAAYLLRVARVLRVSSFEVRNLPRQRDLSGQVFRAVNGAGLQFWVDAVDRAVKASEPLVSAGGGRWTS